MILHRIINIIQKVGNARDYTNNNLVVEHWKTKLHAFDVKIRYFE